MITQNRPYDSFLYGINDLYMPMASGSYYINLENVLAQDSIITQGKPHVLIIVLNNVLSTYPVVLQDVYILDNERLNIIVLDAISNRRITITHLMHSTNVPCWWLVDGEMMQEIVDKLVVLDYCNHQ
jgi:hypothetical protein